MQNNRLFVVIEMLDGRPSVAMVTECHKKAHQRQTEIQNETRNPEVYVEVSELNPSEFAEYLDMPNTLRKQALERACAVYLSAVPTLEQYDAWRAMLDKDSNSALPEFILPWQPLQHMSSWALFDGVETEMAHNARYLENIMKLVASTVKG